MKKTFIKLFCLYFLTFQCLSLIAPLALKASSSSRQEVLIGKDEDSLIDGDDAHMYPLGKGAQYRTQLQLQQALVGTEEDDIEAQNAATQKPAERKIRSLISDFPVFISYCLFFLSLMGNVVAIVLNVYDLTLPATATIAASSGLSVAAAQLLAYHDRRSEENYKKQKKKVQKLKEVVNHDVATLQQYDQTSKQVIHHIVEESLAEQARLKKKSKEKEKDVKTLWAAYHELQGIVQGNTEIPEEVKRHASSTNQSMANLSLQ